MPPDRIKPATDNQATGPTAGSRSPPETTRGASQPALRITQRRVRQSGRPAAEQHADSTELPIRWPARAAHCGRNPAECLRGDGHRRAECHSPRDGLTDLLGHQLVLGAAEHYSLAPGRRLAGRGGDRHSGRRTVSGVDGVRQARAGDRGDVGRSAELGDQPALVVTGCGGDGRPNRHFLVRGRCWLDSGHSADDRNVRFKLGPHRLQGVDGAGVAGHHQDVRLVFHARPGAEQGTLGDVLRRARSPGHPVGVRREHKIGIGPEPVQSCSRSQQA